MMIKNISLVQWIHRLVILKHSRWLLLFLVIAFHHSVAAETSKLWGEKGELWNREGLLRDFTKVGYLEGAEPIPDWPVGVKVTDFGAKGDGMHDDTQAFRDAIAACPEKHAILVPKGRYRITEQITLGAEDKSYFVFRGEDMFESVVFFPYYLTEIYGIPFGKKSRAGNPLNEGFFRFAGGTHRSFETLSFEFREQMNGSHWEFIGADPIYFTGVENSWIRNVYFKNADQVVYLWGGNTKNISVVNAIFDQYIDRSNRSRVGHMPLAVSSSYSLFHNTLLTGKWEHDIITHQSPQHNVWSNYQGPDVEIDHHSAGSDFGLFTEIYGGIGSTNQYDFYGSNETYWNVQSDLELSFSDPKNRSVIVGIHTQEPTETGADFWHENIDPKKLTPANIYLAQLDLVGKPRPVEIPLTIPPQQGEVIVLAATEAGPLNMGEADRNFKGEPLIARVTYQDKSTEKFLLKFDLSKLKSANIPHASLHLRGANAKLLRVMTVEEDSWSEATVSYLSAPKGVLEQNFVTSPVNKEWVDVDITEFARQQMEGDKVLSLLVESTAKGFGGKFPAKGSRNQPRLIIEPEKNATYPAAPTGLKATATEQGLRLEWDASAEDDVKAYNLYRKPRVDNEVPMFGGLVDHHFEDKLVKPGTEYTYSVTAVDAGSRESTPSAELVITP